MSGAKGIVGAFVPFGEAADAVPGAVFPEKFPPPGKNILSLGVLKTVCSATMSSTAPRLLPRWPGFTAQHSTMYCLTSSHSRTRCSGDSFFTSSGELMVLSSSYMHCKDTILLAVGQIQLEFRMAGGRAAEHQRHHYGGDAEAHEHELHGNGAVALLAQDDAGHPLEA